MPQILIVDASPICRELLAKTLEGAGFTVSCATTSAHALESAAASKPDLLIVDPATDTNAMRLIETLRHTPDLRNAGIIILTDLVDKSSVLRAGQLGVRDYMLKQRFSLAELLIRVQKNVRNPDPSAPTRPTAPPPHAPVQPPAPMHAPAPPQNQILPDCVKRLTREQTLARVESNNQAKTLPGAVTEIIGLVNSPRGAISDVAQALKRDPVLAARVLQLANSAAYVSQKPRVTSVDEAVRNIGIGGVRGMVLSIGVFESFTPDGRGDFDILRFWQHSFAVAAIMEKLVPASDAAPAGSAHLVGLCHDLAELAISQQFPEEYAAASDHARRSGQSLDRARSLVFGLPYHELAVALLRKLGLPPMITVPIEEVIERSALKGQAGTGSVLARALRIANVYANALMLPSGPDAAITPLSLTECRSVFGNDPVPLLDDFIIRSEALTMVNMLSGVSARDASSICRPPLERSQSRIWYSRHMIYSELDPVAAFLKMVADVEIHPRAPLLPSEMQDCDLIAVAAPRQCNPLLAQQQVTELLKLTATHPKPILYLSGADPQGLPAGNMLRCLKLPVQLPELVDSLSWCFGQITPHPRLAVA